MVKQYSAAAIGLVLCGATVLAPAVTYEYDGLHRLTRVMYDDGSAIVYEYDAVGNRTLRVISGDPSTVYLDVRVEPPGSGTVIREPNMIWYPLGSQVTLTAVAEGTCEFVEWTGDVPPDPNDPNNPANPSNPLTLTLDRDVFMSVTAHFGSPTGHMDVDCNANGIPDGCEWTDCNANDVLDACDVDPNDPDGNGEVSADCQPNGVPDECDLDPADPDGDGWVSPDANGNGIPDECDCPGDLDGDWDVDLADLAQLLANYGTPSGAIYTDGDLDFDGDVDLSDLAALLAVYGTTCP